MNGAQLHLLLNHLPILGLLFGALLLIFGLLSKQEIISKASMIVFILMGMITVPVNETGEAAEEIVESFPGISVDHDRIHTHEESAELALWLMLGLGTLALVSLIVGDKPNFGKYLQYAVLIASLALFIYMVQVGWQGAQIMHPEIRG